MPLKSSEKIAIVVSAVVLILITFVAIVAIKAPLPYHLSKAEYYLSKGMYDEAIVELDKVILINPKLTRPYLMRAYVYTIKKQYDKAIGDYGSVIRLEPDKPDGYTARGEIYLQTNRYDPAIQDFEKVVKMSPNSAIGLNNLAWTLAISDRELERALNLSKRSLVLSPKDAASWDTLAEIYLRLNRFEEAKKANETARNFVDSPTTVKSIEDRAKKIQEHLPEEDQPESKPLPAESDSKQI